MHDARIEAFRVRIRMLLDQYAQRTKIMIAENKSMGVPNAAIRDIREKELSKWTFEREKLNKEIKRAVAALINRIHIMAYTREI